MQKQRKSKSPGPDAIAAWRTWLDHQYDPGYWPSRGRVPPSWHILYSCLFLMAGSVFFLVAIIGLLRGGSTAGGEIIGGLIVGGLLLAWSVRLLRKTLAKRSVVQRHRRRKRH